MTENKKIEKTPRLYCDLAGWFHLLTAPEDYQTEAAFYRALFLENCHPPPRTLLDLGSGGGNNASHFKSSFKLTLVDRSAEMLEVSRRINPECEHIQGDMRNVRLGRQFDAVFIHDAVSYITTKTDLVKTIKTAYMHCRPGGVALFVPDYVRETFAPSTSHGGHDGGSRGLRYLMWTWDPDPEDTSYIMDFAYLLKDGDAVTCENDRHIMGLFAKDEWVGLMEKMGFSVKVIERQPNWWPPMGTRLFLGIKPEK
ncbi:MAG: class I SAM-dependent methyltransferase [Dehalococcoidales bacterium]|jgi:SAM-dependent methyltransferase